MLDVFILFAELYVLIDTSIHQWQQYGKVRYALLAAALSVLAFIILWALLSPLARLVYDVSPTVWFSSDSLGLLLTAGIHLLFVRFYFYAKRQSVFAPTSERS